MKNHSEISLLGRTVATGWKADVVLMAILGFIWVSGFVVGAAVGG